MNGRVLIVDDDVTIAEGMRQLLALEGIESWATSSPFEFPMLLKRHDPDVVLLDLAMPTLSGERMLELSNKREMHRDARVVFFSGRSPDELSALTERLGATGYLQKGGDVNAMLRRIQFWIRERRALSEARTEADA
ncbi:MAG TPA: response regulator [Thermoanaerobaculia bacterium]|nr:response regulator [Thermoanaerobaculia bacterium]